MSMTLRGSEYGGLDSSPNSFSTPIAFGPILPAMLFTCHEARAQVRAKHAHLIFVWTHEMLVLRGKNAVLGEPDKIQFRIKSPLLRGLIRAIP